MNNINKEYDPNFGYATREDYEKALEDMSMLMWDEFGKKINLKVLSEGKSKGLKFCDLTDPRNLPTVLMENAINNHKVGYEFERINEALNLSYKLLAFFQDSLNYQANDNNLGLLPAVSYFGIQGHLTLEVMRDMLSKNPENYFKQKEDSYRLSA